MIELWLYLDPDPNSRGSWRIAVQNHPFQQSDFPRGHGPYHGEPWELRHARVDGGDYTRVLAGGMADDEVDRLHQEWWAQGEEVTLR